jgi:hypothetical protein
MEEQNKFLDDVVNLMASVLKDCNKGKKDCVCSIRVRYLENSKLPENKKYKTEVFCDEAGNDFHKQITNKLDKKLHKEYT